MKIYEVADFSILPELPNIKLLKKHRQANCWIYIEFVGLCRAQKQFITDSCAKCWRVFLKAWDSTTLKLMC